MNRFVSLVFFLVLVVGGGAAIGMATGPDDWYARLAKPAFNPPSWLFGPVWTCLYVLIAVAGWRVWRGRCGRLIALWWTQLALNFAWSPVFFAAHAIGPALAVILLLLATITAFIIAAWSRDRVAAWLFAPYAAWVAFASLLNAAFLAVN